MGRRGACLGLWAPVAVKSIWWNLSKLRNKVIPALNLLKDTILTCTEPLAVSVSISNETPRRPPRRKTGRHTSSIEEMASRLLDDTTATLQGHETPRTSKRVSGQDKPPLPTKSPKSAANPKTQPIISPRRLSPRLERPALSPDARIRTARVEKHSPKSSARVLRQTPSTRSRADSNQRRKETGLQRPLPQSKTLSLDPLKSHPTTNLKASTSVPLGDVDGNVRYRRAVGADRLAPADTSTDPEDINQKLHAMLAATNALKPSTPQMGNSSASKLTRMVSSRMFAKVSHAWDRLHSKSSFENPRGRDRGEAQVSNELGDGLLNSAFPSPAAMSPISTIEIRLNEGDNLNKKKVQRIVGGQVARKPVADDGKSLRSGKSLDDPFAECGRARTPTTFESRLKKESDNDSDIIPPLPRNPFDSEKGFDNDIEDRILITPPVGSSTPRIRVERVSSASLDDSPTMNHSRSTLLQVNSMLCGVQLGLGREELMRAQPLELIAMKASEGRLVNPVTRTRHDVAEMTPNIDAGGSNRVKKHPSPSKEALEDLEMAFRKYTHLNISGANSDEMDELATSFVSVTPPLVQHDKNRLISNRLSASNIQDLASPSVRRGHSRPLSSSSMMQFSRTLHPLDNARKICGEIRLAPPYRPAGIEDDVDELH